MYNDKFNMTREENVFIAKRNIVDYIYKNARLDGLNITFPDTETIVNGGQIYGLTTSEVVTINNLKHAWELILDTLDYPTEYLLICEINRKVGENLIYAPGFIKATPNYVRYGDERWSPPPLSEPGIRANISNLLNIPSITERSIVLMLYLMRSQMFTDGNKRTSILAANHEMIKHGKGIISIPVDCLDEFNKMLFEYYKSGNMDDIKKLVYDRAIDGEDLSAMREYHNNVDLSAERFDNWKNDIDHNGTAPSFKDTAQLAATEAARRAVEHSDDGDLAQSFGIDES